MGDFLYQSVAEDIEQRIMKGEFTDGQRLPSEREFAITYNISRNVLREAIKILVEKKLVINVMGKGNYVSLPDETDMADMVESALSNTNIDINAIVDAREDLENAIGKRLIENTIISDYSALYDIHNQMKLALSNPEEFSKLDSKFHITMCDMAGNLPIKVFYITLEKLLAKKIYYGGGNSMYGRTTALEEHLNLIKALEQRNLQNFYDIIHLHLDLVRKDF